MQAKLKLKYTIDLSTEETCASISTAGDDATIAALLVAAVTDTLAKIGFTPEQFAEVLLARSTDEDEDEEAEA